MALIWKGGCGGGGGGGTPLPSGGTTGQALVKKSDADRDVEWKSVNGASVVYISDSDIFTAAQFADLAENYDIIKFGWRENTIEYVIGYEFYGNTELRVWTVRQEYWTDPFELVERYYSYPYADFDAPMTLEYLHSTNVSPDFKATIDTLASGGLSGRVNIKDNWYVQDKKHTGDLTLNLDGDLVRLYLEHDVGGVKQTMQKFLVTEDYLGSLTAPNGTRFRLKVDNNGVLSTEAVT